ncbi:NAD-dependent epimerase/dehydratase family protein [candidate division WOR-3 bacterium]|nr:NAD-dependent epimerase/dehydratase family protein [candidate division WOR-3 bacterium]
MKTRKRKVLLTGASGSMGYEAFKELWRRRNSYDIVLLLLPGKLEKKMFKAYERESGIKSIKGRGVVQSRDSQLKIVYGDLTSYQDVAEAVSGIDHVLHPAALISPAADHNPELARKVNYGGALNIIKAVKEQPQGAERISLVNIGSVAFYGDRLPPVALLRAGDPLMPSVFDFYAVSKIAAERAVIESGITHWVSMRQTFIAIPDITSLMDPIMFHQPLGQHIEMCTPRDAGFGLVQTLEQPLDSDFWCRVYNQTGGPSCRFVYYNYLERMFRLLGIGDMRRLMEPGWFCLRNFHDAWYADSRILDGYLHHQRESYASHIDQVSAAVPWYMKLARFVPAPVIKQLFIKPLAESKDGPLYWKKHPEEMPLRIKAFYGSASNRCQERRWEDVLGSCPAGSRILEHGYDERKSVDDLSMGELRKAAGFRGGELLSSHYSGDRSYKLLWRCAFGHEFYASVAAVLLGGHWCPECEAPPWNYDSIASKNPFLAQAYYNTHEKEENNFYSEAGCLQEML